MNIELVPLSKLSLSDLNVRKTERDADIASLADDIAEKGLKQNLIVVPNGKPGHFEVVAGGRRFQALQLLVERKALKPSHKVAVLIEAREDGVETSLSENLHRVAMNPADEFFAFKTIIDGADGETGDRVAYCAKRFGVTEAHVRGRLRLAGLADVVLEALRGNVINLTQAMAYASVSDTELQAKVFAKQAKNGWKPHDPDNVRSELKGKAYGSDNPKVKFIGLDTYIEAGGRLDRDLFTPNAIDLLLDTALVDKLVKAEFDKRKDRLAKKHKVEGVVLGSSSYQPGPTPEGWEAEYDWRGEKLKERQKAKLPTMISVYLDADGKLVMGDRIFIPAEPKAQEPERPQYRPMTDEERAAAQRASRIGIEAFRLAFPLTKGTAFEGRIFLPAIGEWFRMDEQDDGYLLQAHVWVSKEELAAQLEAAAPVYDAWVEQEAVRKAEKQAAREAAEKANEETVAKVRENPPAVISIETQYGDEFVLYRWEEGQYYDVPELNDGDDVDMGYESLAELLDDEPTILGHWDSIDAYEAHAEAQDAAATADTE